MLIIGLCTSNLCLKSYVSEYVMDKPGSLLALILIQNYRQTSFMEYLDEKVKKYHNINFRECFLRTPQTYSLYSYVLNKLLAGIKNDMNIYNKLVAYANILLEILESN